MSEGDLSRYACDRCQSRKVTCTRERSGCKRCASLECTYSRKGVIRRSRKRKHDTLGEASSTGLSPLASHDETQSLQKASTDTHAALGSHMTADIETARETLGADGLGTSLKSQGALSSLAKACAAVWHDESDFDMSSKSFFLFEEHTAAWVDIFAATLERGRPLLQIAPDAILAHLRTCRPDLVRERAWLVMYYGIVLSNITSNDPTNESIKAKLRCNLWLALNDARLFLEPSEANIQALTILACHVEEFTTPSLCWMLTTTACKMLQSLGVNHRRLDPQTRERRILIFFHLNILDKGLSVTFGRPPTFHRAMSREIPPPTLEQLRPLQPHVTTAGTSSLFAVHFFHQMMFLTRILGDVWYCLYEDAEPSDSSIQSEIEKLGQWHLQAKNILDAAAMTERPFMPVESVTSIDLGLRMIDFQYHYIMILLCRVSPSFRPRAVSSSKQMLSLLPHMVSDSEEPFNGIVWQLVCSPFTAFLTLFNDVLSHQRHDADHASAVAAMEELPKYLGRMSLRSSLAKKLERVAAALLEHAKSVVAAQATRPIEFEMSHDLDFWDSTFKGILSTSDQYINNENAFQAVEFPDWTLDTFGDPGLDWIGWDALN